MYKMNKLLTFLSLSAILLQFHTSESANILFSVPIGHKSHFQNIGLIVKELAKREHNVTLITGIKENSTANNCMYRRVIVQNNFEKLGPVNRYSFLDLTEIQHHDGIRRRSFHMTNAALNSTELHEFLKEDLHFDLVVNEQFYNEAFNVLATKYNCPLVLINTVGNCMKCNAALGNPLQMNFLISDYARTKDFHSFWSRLENLYISIYEYLVWRYQYLVIQENLIEKYIPSLAEGMPKIYDTQKDVALFLMNRHHSFEFPAAYLPNMVEIGGVHLTEVEGSLPDDLQKVLDMSAEGVIYMCFGTLATISELTPVKINTFIEVFKKLNLTVLLKSEKEIEGMPVKVLSRKWFPQRQILAHPHIRLFITHGGINGIQEALYNGVPLLGIPAFADQTRNMLQAELSGIGKLVNYHDIEKELEKNIIEMLTNDSYRIRAKKLALIYRDRRRTALETSVLWIEHVIKNKGFVEFGNPDRHQNWFEYYMFDVFAIILVAVCVFIYVAVQINKYLFIKLNYHNKNKLS